MYETGHKIQCMAKVLPKMLESVNGLIHRQKRQTRYFENSTEPWKLEKVLLREQSASVAPHVH